MPRQLLLPGFPSGASRISEAVSLLRKEGVVTYFVWGDNYFSHREGDKAAFRFAVASLLANRLVRPCEVERAPLCIAHRTLMNWERQLREQGSSSLFCPVRRAGGRVLTPQKVAQCERGLAEGLGIREVAGRAGMKESTLRKALRRGSVRRRVQNPRVRIHLVRDLPRPRPWETSERPMWHVREAFPVTRGGWDGGFGGTMRPSA